MAFKGFAREEGFSTHQINLDIAAVINNDLAEANRQSRYMARNAQLQEQWSNSYLTAMNQKHAAEAQNRRDNFQFFMENRKQIHEQHQKNRQIEFEDAGVDRYVPSLESMLGPALLKMAVNVGSAAISKAFKDENQRIADEKGETVAAAADLYASGSDEQQGFVAEGGFGPTYQKMSVMEQAKTREYFNSLGDFKASELNVAAVHRINGLSDRDRQLAEHSRENTANRFNDFIRNLPPIDMNGRGVSLYDLPTANPATFSKWWSTATDKYIQSIWGDKGIVPEAMQQIGSALKQIQGQHASRNDTRRYQTAQVEINEQVMQALDQRDASGRAEFLFAAAGDDGRSLYSLITGKGLGEAWKTAVKFYGHQSAPAIKEFYNTPTFQGRSLAQDPTSTRSRIFQGLIRDAHTREHQSYENLQISQDNQGEHLIEQIKSGEIGDDTLKFWLHQSQFSDQNVGINPILGNVSPSVARDINSTILKALGKDPNTQAVSTAKSIVDQAFPSSERQQMLTAAVLGNLSQSDRPWASEVQKALKDNPWRFQSVVNGWINGIRRSVDPRGQMSPEQLRDHIAPKINKKDDPDWHTFVTLTQPLITEEKNGMKTVSFPGMENYIKNNISGATAMSQAYTLIANKSVGDARSAITQDPTIIEVARPWMDRLHTAQKAGADLGPILDQMPKVLRYLGSRTPNGDGSQWVNYLIEDHFTDMKPLSGDDLFTPEEAAKANSLITGITKKLKAQQDFMLNNVQPYSPNFNSQQHIARNQAPASNVTPASSSVSHMGSGLHAVGMPAALGGGQDGTWTDPNHEDHFDLKWNRDGQAQWMYDYFKLHNIVMTEVKGRGDDITVPHSKTGDFTHGSGHGGDVPLDSRNGLGGGAVGMEADHIFRDKLFTRLKSGGDHFTKGLTPQEAYEFDLYGGRTYPARSFN